MTITKAKISITEGTIELEGTEEFVRTYLDEFKSLVTAAPPKSAPPVKKKTAPKKKVRTTSTDEAEDGKPSKRKKAPTKITAERFDVHGGDGVPSLEEYISEKNPGRANGEKIAVIGHYITEVLDMGSFSEGQIEYAYKMLKYPRPNHLHQIIINMKSQNDWFEQEEDGTTWNLTRTGDIFVSDTLPKKDS